MRVGLQLNNISLIEEFISGCPNFWHEDIEGVDNKHKSILNKFETIYQNNLVKFAENIIDWEEQNDEGVPFQITKYHLKTQKLKTIFYNIIREIKRNVTFSQFDKSSFLDDIAILKKNRSL